MLCADDLRFSFPGRTVLSGISVEIQAGTRTAIIGPNGSGKSTLLRLLGGFLSPEAGSVLLDRKPVHALTPRVRARRIAYVPQATALAFPFSVRRFVAFGRHALAGDSLAADVEHALTSVDLLDRADDALGELSQGQQQRASIARAVCQIAGMPSGGAHLLADEPTASLDPAHQLTVHRLMADLADRGVGVAAAVHDLAAAADFDRVLLLDASGSPIAEGPAGEVVVPELLERAFGVGFESVHDHTGRLAAVVPADRRT